MPECLCPSSRFAESRNGTCVDDCVIASGCCDVDSAIGSGSKSMLIGFCGTRRPRALTVVLADCTVMASPRRWTGVGIPGTSFPPTLSH